jgi:hypothetical protein
MPDGSRRFNFWWWFVGIKIREKEEDKIEEDELGL